MRDSRMTRRGSPGIKAFGLVAVVGLFLFGMWSYHDLHTRHRRSEEKAEKLRQQHDSISAQLQVVYEHKSRIEKSLQQEKSDHKKTREDLNQEKSSLLSGFTSEKKELLDRVNSVNSELKLTKGRHEDLQSEFTKLQEDLSKQEEDQKKISAQHNTEFMQFRQEKENEVATLKDKIANQERHKTQLEGQLQQCQQNNFVNQNQMNADQQKITELTQQLQVLENQAQANPQQNGLQQGGAVNLNQQANVIPAKFNPAQPGLPLQQQGLQQQGVQQQVLQGGAPLGQQPAFQNQNQNQNQNMLPRGQGFQQVDQHGVAHNSQGLAQNNNQAFNMNQQGANQPIGGQNQQMNQDNVMQAAPPKQNVPHQDQDEDQGNMQVAPPGQGDDKAAYFEPKKAIPDHDNAAVGGAESREKENNEGENIHQVAPPRLGEKAERQDDVDEEKGAAQGEEGANVKDNDGDVGDPDRRLDDLERDRMDGRLRFGEGDQNQNQAAQARRPILEPEQDHFGRPLVKDAVKERRRRRLGRGVPRAPPVRAPRKADGKRLRDLGRLGGRGNDDLGDDPFARQGNPRGGDQGAKRIINNPNNIHVYRDNVKGPLGVNKFVNDDDDDDDYGDDDVDYADDDNAGDDNDDAFNGDDTHFQVQQPRVDDGKAGAMGGMGPRNPDPIVGNLGVDGGDNNDEGLKGPLGQGQMDRPDEVVVPQQGALENQVALPDQGGDRDDVDEKEKEYADKDYNDDHDGDNGAVDGQEIEKPADIGDNAQDDIDNNMINGNPDNEKDAMYQEDEDEEDNDKNPDNDQA